MIRLSKGARLILPMINLGEWNFYDVICNNDESSVTEDRRWIYFKRFEGMIFNAN